MGIRYDTTYRSNDCTGGLFPRSIWLLLWICPATGIRMTDNEKLLAAALVWLLDDLTDAGEDRHPETGVEYDSVTFAHDALVKVGAT